MALGRGVGAEQAEEVGAERPPGGPRLLAVQHPAAVDPLGLRTDGGEVGAGVGFGPALAPQVLGCGHAGEDVVLLLLVPEREDGGREQEDAVLGDPLRAAGPVVLLLEDQPLPDRGVAPAVGLGPRDDGPPIGEQRPLPVEVASEAVAGVARAEVVGTLASSQARASARNASCSSLQRQVHDGDSDGVSDRWGNHSGRTSAASSSGVIEPGGAPLVARRRPIRCNPSLTGVGTPCRRPRSTISPLNRSVSIEPVPRARLCHDEPPPRGLPSIGRRVRWSPRRVRSSSAVADVDARSGDRGLGLGLHGIEHRPRCRALARTRLGRRCRGWSAACATSIASRRGATTDSKVDARNAAGDDLGPVVDACGKRPMSRMPVVGAELAWTTPGSRWVAGSITGTA